eukprot:s94_g36.t1
MRRMKDGPNQRNVEKPLQKQLLEAFVIGSDFFNARFEQRRLQSTLRDEVRIVHNEVMSLDARVSLLEEQGITSMVTATPELLKRDRQGFRLPGSGRQDVTSPAQRASHAQEGHSEGESGDGQIGQVNLMPRLNRRISWIHDGLGQQEPNEVLRQVRPMQETGASNS